MTYSKGGTSGSYRNDLYKKVGNRWAWLGGNQGGYPTYGQKGNWSLNTLRFFLFLKILKGLQLLLIGLVTVSMSHHRLELTRKVTLGCMAVRVKQHKLQLVFSLKCGNGMAVIGLGCQVKYFIIFSNHVIDWFIIGINSINQLGTYGTIGVANATAFPGSRRSIGTWMDSNDNYWVFGGYGYGSVGGQGSLSDLWKYSTVDNVWTWVSGSNVVDPTPVFGRKGKKDHPLDNPLKYLKPILTSHKVLPIPATEFLVFIIQVCGAMEPIFMYSEVIYSEQDTKVKNKQIIFSFIHFTILAYMNTVWKYDGTDWTWIGGSDRAQIGSNYVGKNANSAEAFPCSRRSYVVPYGNKGYFYGELGNQEMQGANGKVNSYFT